MTSERKSLLRRVLKKLAQPLYDVCVPSELAVFPDIEVDLQPVRSLLRGKVLNAGAGSRDISRFVEGEVINLDLPSEDGKGLADICGSVESIPIASSSFDVVISIGVLEHVKNPEAAVAEMFRVLRPGGRLILEIPFLQPEHKVPTDFQRYTRDGMIALATRHGFEVEVIRGMFTVYHTLYWQVFIWLHLKSDLTYVLLRFLLLRPLLFAARRSSTYSDQLSSGFQLVARKPLS